MDNFNNHASATSSSPEVKVGSVNPAEREPEPKPPVYPSAVAAANAYFGERQGQGQAHKDRQTLTVVVKSGQAGLTREGLPYEVWHGTTTDGSRTDTEVEEIAIVQIGAELWQVNQEDQFTCLGFNG